MTSPASRCAPRTAGRPPGCSRAGCSSTPTGTSTSTAPPATPASSRPTRSARPACRSAAPPSRCRSPPAARCSVGAGTMWVDGLLARNPADLSYADQAQIAPLPTAGTWVVYLDVFPEEVQAAEDPAELLDPALDGIDTTTRTRVGWRVRVAAAETPTCGGATFPRGAEHRPARRRPQRRARSTPTRARRRTTRGPSCPTGCCGSRSSTPGPRRPPASAGRTPTARTRSPRPSPAPPSRSPRRAR